MSLEKWRSKSGTHPLNARAPSNTVDPCMNDCAIADCTRGAPSCQAFSKCVKTVIALYTPLNYRHRQNSAPTALLTCGWTPGSFSLNCYFMRPLITMATLFQPTFCATLLATYQIKQQVSSPCDQTDDFVDLLSKRVAKRFLRLEKGKSGKVVLRSMTSAQAGPKRHSADKLFLYVCPHFTTNSP